MSRTLAAGAFVAVAALGVTACDGENLPDLGSATTAPDGGDGAAPAPTEAPAPQPTEAPAPQPTEAPAPQPTDASAPEPTAAPDAGDDDGSGELWLVLLGLVAVGAIIALLVGSRRSSSASAVVPDRRLELLATAGWVHDHLTLEILAMPPAEARQRWALERGRVDQLAVDGRLMASSGYREMWEQLGTILAQLSSSIDTALRVGATPGADPALVAEAVQNARRHRAELGAWVATARTLV